MRVAFYSPMPPSKTGVAHYSAILVPALQKQVEVEVNPATQRPSDPATPSIYQLGNNPQHEFVYREAMKNPGVIVLHDIVLHHLIVEMTLARGDAEGYIAAMRANHGDMGEAWARGRIIGLHDEIANFLMPASIDIANRSRAVIVHNQYAADRLTSLGVETPIFVVPHPFKPRPEARGPRPEEPVVGFFGFLTSAKRAEVVLAAFRLARSRDPRLRLLIVGEPAPNIRVPSGEGITVTGYVDDAQFDEYYSKVDRLVNLRYPSAGETSGTLIRAFEAGLPVAVSDYAQFAELPDDIVTKIPFGDDEVQRLAEFFLRDHSSPAAAQRKWLDENATIEKTVQGYMRALSGGQAPRLSTAGQAGASVLQLFPHVGMTWDGATVTLKNLGDTTLLAGEYGQPGYRAILKLGDTDRWVALPGDLRPGESVEIPFQGSGRLTLTNALEGIAIVDETPAAEVELERVR
ncbi:MAG TPA: glycosyltransferase family 4 protein [Thermoanaerobaculia bacterium]